MSEWTPSAWYVREQFACGSDGDYRNEEEMRAAFDRWLAEHDREVAAEAWDEGYQAGTYDESAFYRWLAEHDREVAEEAWDEGYRTGRIPNRQEHVNPYRKETA